jgi:predicted aminopeptidase
MVLNTMVDGRLTWGRFPAPSPRPSPSAELRRVAEGRASGSVLSAAPACGVCGREGRAGWGAGGRAWLGRAAGAVRRWATGLGFVAGVVMALLTSGCRSIGYYHQAVAGHWEVMAKRERVERLLEREEVDGSLRERLRLAVELCGFAERELGLPGRRQYLHYADLGRAYVVWNVFASREFSLEPKGWWYPVVGRLEYRGYFREGLAKEYAQRLEERGYDVFVGGVEAYSTLGWFRDPILNTFVHLPEPELADLLFHELAHHRLFIPGDTDFNEAFATVVAREGVRRWLAAGDRWEEGARYLQRLSRDDQVALMILGVRQRLEALYAGASGMGLGAIRREKAAVIERLRQDYAARKLDWPGYDGYDGWMSGPINNAQLNSVEAYMRWVPVMESLLAGAGGQLGEFYRMMERLRGRSQSERRETLRWFEARLFPGSGCRPVDAEGSIDASGSGDGPAS